MTKRKNGDDYMAKKVKDKEKDLPEIIEDPHNKVVAEQNKVIQAVAKMSPASIKLFEIAVGSMKLNEDGKPVSDRVRIRKSMIYKLMGSKGNSRGKRLNEQLDELWHQAMFEFKAEDKEMGEIIHKLAPISHIYWAVNPRIDYVTLKFDSDFLPMISDLQRDYTSYRLEEVAALSTKYSIILYRQIAMNYNQYLYYRKKGERSQKYLDRFANPIISLDELHRLFDLSKSYLRFRDFYRFVLKGAVEEVNAKTPYTLTYDRLKTGRKITALQFHIKLEQSKPAENKPMSYEDAMNSDYTKLLIATGLLSPSALLNKELILSLAKDLYPEYEQFVNTYDKDKLQQHMEYVAKRKENETDNLVNYLVTAIKNYQEKLKIKKGKQSESKKHHGKQLEKIPESWNENKKVKKSSPQDIAELHEKLLRFRKKLTK